MTLEQIINSYPDEEFLVADGLDEAIIGVDESTMRLIYSESKCIEILSRKSSTERALEFFYCEIKDTYTGSKTPIWCSDDFE